MTFKKITADSITDLQSKIAEEHSFIVQVSIAPLRLIKADKFSLLKCFVFVEMSSDTNADVLEAALIAAGIYTEMNGNSEIQGLCAPISEWHRAYSGQINLDWHPEIKRKIEKRNMLQMLGRLPDDYFQSIW